MSNVDIGILTVLPVELNAAQRVFKIDALSRVKAQGTVYFRHQIHSKLTNSEYSLVTTCIGSAGLSSASAATASLIQVFRPKLVVLLGIAAGQKEKLKIGQVIFAERIVSYGSLVELEDKQETRPTMDTLEHAIKQDLNVYQADDARCGRITEIFLGAGGEFLEPTNAQDLNWFSNHVMSKISPSISSLASGDILFRNEDKLRELRDLHGKIEGAEMEAAGFIAAARQSSTSWLVVRGVSDFGDAHKDDRFHDFAALTASSVLGDFLSCGLELSNTNQLHPVPSNPEHRSPNLTVTFAEGQTKATFQWAPSRVPTENETQKELERNQRSLGHALAFVNCQPYFALYEGFVRKTNQAIAFKERTLDVAFLISNIGNMPAEDVDLEVIFPAFLDIQKELPSPPIEPRKPMPSGFDYDFPVSERSLPERLMDSVQEWRLGANRNYVYKIRKLKHQDTHITKPLYLTF